jgi:predicted nucleic acid-binding protein
MAGFVPDASVALAWCFEDEATAATDALLKSLKEGSDAIVPAHWPMEITNGLLMAVRRGRISEDKARRFLDDLGALPIRMEADAIVPTCSSVFVLGQQHRLTAYDAAYLELAIRRNLSLATTDEALSRAAGKAGVMLVTVK